ncbi:MAG: head GIN domain-containing protein [Nannocystaceae bacterium]
MTHLNRAPTRLLATGASFYNLSSCSLNIVGNGYATTMPHRVASFYAIESTGPVDLVVSVGAEQSVSLRCDSNLHEHINVFVDDHELVIETGHESISPRTDCTATIVTDTLYDLKTAGSGDIQVNGPTPDLYRVQSTGSGDVRIAEVTSAKLELFTTGSGDATIIGVTGHARLETTGSGGLYARKLVARAAVVRSTGSGSVDVHATESVHVRTSGSGNVDIWGAPQSRYVTTAGSGEVHYHE